MDGSKCGSRQLVALTFLAIFISSVLAFEKALDKAKIDGVDTHDLDVFIEKKVRYLHAKVDLKPAITGLITLDKCVKQLAKSSAESLEYTLSKSLQKRVGRIVARLARISGKEYITARDKRSIEFIGDLISDIFGNPGPTDWKKVNSNLLALEGALKRIDENVNLNHGDIDTDRHIIELHNKEIKSLSTLINRNQNELVNMNNEMQGLKIFFEISTLADTLDSLTLALIEIKTDGTRGFCSDRAIDKNFLVENIQSMEANKAGLSPIFGSWEWRNYFKYEMCTLAMVNEALWVTIRIPLVKKSERLVRVIPSTSMKRLVDRTEMYGVKMALFREKDNDKFHLMTQSTFDLCNVLGNTRTCGTRDVRVAAQSSIIAVEFLMDRFMIVSNKVASVKVTEKCPGMVREVLLHLDSVINAPVNCSYLANGFSIDTREADVEITKEVGIISIDRLEISKIENFHDNVSRIFVEAIANRSSNSIFERNTNEIKERLDAVDTKHETAWNSYNVEKWIIVACLITLAIVFGLLKMRSSFVSKRVRSTTFNEIAELRSNLRLTQNEFRQETINLQQLKIEDKSVECVAMSTTDEHKKPNFSSPLHRSQFL
jgi:hypothetical protein